MGRFDIKVLLAVLMTLLSLLYLGTFYYDELDLAPADRALQKPMAVVNAQQSSFNHELDRTLSAKIIPPQSPTSKYAYCTLLHGIDESYRYRGFLYNTIILKKLLSRLGSKEDVIAMVGFTKGNNNFDEDIKLMESFGIKVHYLPRMTDSEKVNFAEMALLKITPFSFIQYEAVQYLDADVMPRKNLDVYFQLKRNSYHTGSASPVNSGWFLAIPNMNHYNELWKKAVVRLNSKWDPKMGWGTELPPDLFYRGGQRVVKDWNFNGASLDQGLFTYYFVLNYGQIQLFDVREVRKYDKGYVLKGKEDMAKGLSCCGSRPPMDFFAHFTGRNKPWLKSPEDRKGSDVRMWFETLDSLKLPVNSTSPLLTQMTSPLGYFHANK